MPGELGDELLAHHPRGAKHSDVDPLHDLLLLLGYFGAELKFCPTSVTCGAGLQSCAPPFPSLLDTIRAKKNRRPAGAASAGVCSLVDLL